MKKGTFQCHCGHRETLAWGEFKTHECVIDRTGEPNDLAVAGEISKAALVPSNPLGNEGEVGNAQVASTNEKTGSRTAPDR